MPGLFGVVFAQPHGARVSEAELDTLLERMADTLSNGADERIERHVDAARGIALARIGRPHLDAADWPLRDAGREVFAAGRPAIGGPDGGLSGAYAAAILEPDGSFTLQADRRGSRRLFYGSWRGRLHFAPQVSALLATPDAPRDMDVGAFATFLASGVLYRDQTLFTAIRRLKGGTRLRRVSGEIRREDYFDFTPGARAAPDADHRDLARECADSLREAVAPRLGDLGRTIFYMSGGLDSRLLLAAALAEGARAREIETVTWGDFTGGPGSDIGIAGELARSTGVRHRVLLRENADFGDKFRSANTLLDGMCQMAADHPDESRIMKALYDDGFRIAFRGDQALSVTKPAFTLEQAWRSTGLRRLSEASSTLALLDPDFRAGAVDASEEVFAKIEHDCRDLTPDQAKDKLYFLGRLPNYIAGATYWRQIYFEEHASLIDDSILDILERTPDALRAKRRIFSEALAILSPQLSQAPYAEESNLTGWAARLAVGESEGDFYSAALDDADSGFWSLVDRDAVLALLSTLRSSGRAKRSTRQRVLRSAKKVMEALRPSLAFSIATRLARGDDPPATILRRILILKDWHDRFGPGAGRASAAAARAGQIRSTAEH